MLEGATLMALVSCCLFDVGVGAVMLAVMGICAARGSSGCVGLIEVAWYTSGGLAACVLFFGDAGASCWRESCDACCVAGHACL